MSTCWERLSDGRIGGRIPCPDNVLLEEYSNSCIQYDLVGVRSEDQIRADPSCDPPPPPPPPPPAPAPPSPAASTLVADPATNSGVIVSAAVAVIVVCGLVLKMVCVKKQDKAAGGGGGGGGELSAPLTNATRKECEF